MVQISRKTDLATFIPRGGYETTVAQSEATVMYAANDTNPNRGNAWGAYSLDSGRTFAPIDAMSMTRGLGETLCCDRVGSLPDHRRYDVQAAPRPVA
jgi:hypothetical protein